MRSCERARDPGSLSRDTEHTARRRFVLIFDHQPLTFGIVSELKYSLLSHTTSTSTAVISLPEGLLFKPQPRTDTNGQSYHPGTSLVRLLGESHFASVLPPSALQLRLVSFSQLIIGPMEPFTIPLPHDRYIVEASRHYRFCGIPMFVH